MGQLGLSHSSFLEDLECRHRQIKWIHKAPRGPVLAPVTPILRADGPMAFPREVFLGCGVKVDMSRRFEDPVGGDDVRSIVDIVRL